MISVNWQGETLSCREMKIHPGYIRIGDFILYQGEMTRVATVQTGCPYLENINRYFIHLVLETRDGREVMARNTDRNGKWQVLRNRKGRR